MYKPNYWDIKELVSPEVYRVWGEAAWQFFDDEYLIDLDIIREEWGDTLIINNWAWGGNFNESGLRDNLCSIVRSKKKLYLSGHVLAKGFDIKPQNGKHDKFWHFVLSLMRKGKLKKLTRLEHFKHTPTWCHIDGLTLTGKTEVFTI